MTVEALAKQIEEAVKCDCGKKMYQCDGCGLPLCWKCDDHDGDAERFNCLPCEAKYQAECGYPWLLKAMPFVPEAL